MSADQPLSKKTLASGAASVAAVAPGLAAGGLPDADARQRRAADPAASVWVGASAGSGKTKVLTDRLLRLMLPHADGQAGTAPHRILCLTFTKAAASEMALRLNKRLGRWAVMPEDALRADLAGLLGTDPAPAIMAAARRLFAAVVDTPGGLKIMTIHAFCQSVLGRFPLEAGLPPYFKGLDEGAAHILLAQARDDLLTYARARPASAEGQALAALAASQNADAFHHLLAAMVQERHQLRSVLARHGGWDGVVRALYDFFESDSQQTAETLVAAACADGAYDVTGLRGACKALAEWGGKTDHALSVSIQNWLDAPFDRKCDEFSLYTAGYLTQKGTIRAKLAANDVAKKAPDVPIVLQAEAERLLAVEEAVKRIQAAALTQALLLLGLAVLERYEAAKAARAALDFDDLIIKTLELLERDSMAGWVMFKLDGGLDHILIDEAQDTNPEQWDIVRALCQDFFAGAGARSESVRTLFSVGDEKQSIYSFQRAAPEKFNDMRAYFADRVQAAGQVWRNESMNISFRSVAPVLSFVDEVFAPDAVRAGLGIVPLAHESWRQGQPGLVELWPLFCPAADGDAEGSDTLSWLVADRPRDSRSPAAQLADQIGTLIAGWLARGEMLESKGRPIEAGDIMILVRRRTAFVNQLMRALKTRGVPVNGLDRMILKDQLAVQDMLAAAQFALLPEDDLTLACLLKSPLIGWTDQDLEAYAIDRTPGVRLWDVLRQRAAAVSSAPAQAEALAGETTDSVTADDMTGNSTRARPAALSAPAVLHGDAQAAASVPGAPLAVALAYLDSLIRHAALDHPYEFFSRLLQEPCPACARGGLYAMTARLGAEALDPLDEFLNLALAYERQSTPALQGFLVAVQRADSEIKREQEEAGQQVRIMTVHGAKGLQAPIVILPDTTRTTRTGGGSQSYRLIWPHKSGLAVPVWAPRADREPDMYKAVRAVEDARQDEEYRRLLYVAMTRAEDRLYVMGYEGARRSMPESWYHYMAQAMERRADAHMTAFEEMYGKSPLDTMYQKEDARRVWRIGAVPSPMATASPVRSEPLVTDADSLTPAVSGASLSLEGAAGEAAPAPLSRSPSTTGASASPEPDVALKQGGHAAAPADWLLTMPGAEPQPARPLMPSRPSGAEPPARSPLVGTAADGRYRRGDVTHTLLQFLPDVPRAQQEDVARRHIARMGADLSESLRQDILSETLAVIHHPEWGVLFGPDSLAEVPVTGMVGADLVSGQIDRLYVSADTIWIVDYKTNRPPPARPEDIPPVYRHQMKLYGDIVSKIYEGRAVKAYLLWTDTLTLMPVEI